MLLHHISQCVMSSSNLVGAKAVPTSTYQDAGHGESGLQESVLVVGPLLLSISQTRAEQTAPPTEPHCSMTEAREALFDSRGVPKACPSVLLLWVTRPDGVRVKRPAVRQSPRLRTKSPIGRRIGPRPASTKWIRIPLRPPTDPGVCQSNTGYYEGGNLVAELGRTSEPVYV